MKIFIHIRKKSFIFLSKNQTKVVYNFEKCNYIQPKFIIIHTYHQEKLFKLSPDDKFIQEYLT